MTTNTEKEFEVGIGKKPPRNYVLYIISRILRGTNKVVLKARGRNISTAVDVAEMLVKRNLPNWKISSITTDSEEVEFTSKDGNTYRKTVSNITIVVEKQG